MRSVPAETALLFGGKRPLQRGRRPQPLRLPLVGLELLAESLQDGFARSARSSRSF
jgi:hypothetical protein